MNRTPQSRRLHRPQPDRRAHAGPHGARRCDPPKTGSGGWENSLISLTARTMKLIAPARAIIARGNREALAAFNDSEVEQLVALLQRVIANVSEGSDYSPESRVGTKPIPSNRVADVQ